MNVVKVMLKKHGIDEAYINPSRNPPPQFSGGLPARHRVNSSTEASFRRESGGSNARLEVASRACDRSTLRPPAEAGEPDGVTSNLKMG